jgi:hypothetical protein
MFSVVSPGLLLFIPLALALVALPPRRGPLVMVGVGVLAVVLFGQSSETMWWFGRGWALMLGAWFVIVVSVQPEGGFVNRGLAAVCGTLSSAAALMATQRSNWRQFDGSVAQHMRDSAAQAATQLEPSLANREWGKDAIEAVHKSAELNAMIYPAWTALGSLCALAVVWWLWRRLTVRDARPLGGLREFRFRDELIWLGVAGVLLIVLPLNAGATRTGTNLAMFMGVLYALRGLGVGISLYGVPGPLGLIVGLLLLVFLFPMVATATLVLGLSDTWLDLRARAGRNVRPM